MRSRIAALLLVLLLGTLFGTLFATFAQAQDDVVMRAMKDELARSVAQLQLQKMDKPYFLAYRMDEINQNSISATLGSLTQDQPLRMRMIGVEVRVGDYALDNSNYLSSRMFGGGRAGFLSGISQAPLDDDYQQIRRDFWLATDSQYKKALEDFSGKRAALDMRKHTDDVPDFSRETPTTKMEPPEKSRAGDDLKTLARDISAVFRNTPEIYGSSVDLEYRNYYTRYINSEGSTFTRAQTSFKLRINAQTQAPDGLPISESIAVFGRTMADLPAKDALLSRTRAIADRILKLRTAGSLERYNGPVLFEGDAAGEIFAQQFATGLMAVRTPLSDNPQFEMYFNQLMSQLGGGGSLVDKIGGRVLPDFLSVSDNPLRADYQGTILMGAGKIDDDAVETRETRLVEHGTLKTLLATRTPVRAVLHSTGSRRGYGPSPSNLFLTSEKSSTNDKLRKELLRRAKDRGLDYGIVVRRVGAGAAASFVKMATRMAQQGQGSGSLAEVYKLYPDGHEELIRGVEIAEMLPSTFKDIVAVGDTPAVFTDEFIPPVGALFAAGISGSSDVPIVSCVVPSLLFEEVSLVKSQGPFPNPMISPSPLAKQ
ncbi:MAG: metallopeptidase TldD-related protein [Terriglobales bacterium]|jgi:predicted Zn-dependent protease